MQGDSTLYLQLFAGIGHVGTDEVVFLKLQRNDTTLDSLGIWMAGESLRHADGLVLREDSSSCYMRS